MKDADGPPRRGHAFVLVVIAMLAMIGPFTIDTVFPAFAHIGSDLGATPAAMQQVTSVYMLSFAVMSLWHGPISDSVGRKPVIVVGLLAYAGASLVCALAPSLTILLIGRALQGVAAGAGQIISRTMIRDLFSGPSAQKMMAQVSMIFAIAPAVAPIVGGWVLGVGSWHLIFWALVVLGVGLAALVGFGMPETHPVDARVSMSVVGVLTSLKMVFQDVPYLRLAFAGVFAFAAQFLYVVGAPIIILNLLGKGEQDFWMIFVPMVGGMMTGSYLTSRLSHSVPADTLASVGFGVVLVAAAVNVLLAALPATQALPWVLVAPPVAALGMAIVFPVLQLQQLDRFPHHRGAAASGQSFIALLFNSALAGLVIPLVATSMATIALTGLGFSLAGAWLWVWQVRAQPRLIWSDR